MSALDDMKGMLREAPLFADLADDQLMEVAGCATVQVFDANSMIIRDGQPATKLFLIRHGTVAVELTASTGRIVLQTLHDGEVLGWSWVMQRKSWGFDGRAVTLVRAVVIDAVRLLDKMESNHELGYQVLRRMVGVMAQRLTAARLQMLDLYTPGQAPQS